MSVEDLHEVTEGDADDHKFVEDLEKARVGEHAVLEAVVEEVVVQHQHFVNVAYLVCCGVVL